MSETGLKITAKLGALQGPVEAALAGLERDRAAQRIWSGDHTLWKPEPKEISNRLGWLTSARDMRPRLAGLRELAERVRSEGYDRAVLLGMGGSSLAPEVLSRIFGSAPGWLDLAVLDSTDPGAVLALAEGLDLGRTLFIVASKSGTTVEPLSFFKFFYNRTAEALGAGAAGAHFLAVTDPGSLLAGQAQEHGFRAALLNDPNIGGRYSVLSCFGLAPAALMGLTVERLVDRAEATAAACGPERTGADNPGLYLGAIMGQAALNGRDKLTLVASDRLAPFGDWLEQLIAESTGKESKGILPVVGEPLGPAKTYGPDRLFIQLKLTGQEAGGRALAGLEEAGQPVVRLELRDAYDLGGQFFLWEMATAVAGRLLAINPFDQPDVEAAKVLARQSLAEYAQKGRLPEQKPVLVESGLSLFGQAAGASLREALQAFLAQAELGAYLALQAYLPPRPETEAALQAIRLRLRDRLKLATTLGFGPRFLHSTGQLHKGDAGRGLFIQLTADQPRDAPIPDEIGSSASSVSFGVLETAQVLGDGQALAQAGRRVIRLHLGAEVDRGLRRFKEALP